MAWHCIVLPPSSHDVLTISVPSFCEHRPVSPVVWRLPSNAAIKTAINGVAPGVGTPPW